MDKIQKHENLFNEYFAAREKQIDYAPILKKRTNSAAAPSHHKRSLNGLKTMSFGGAAGAGSSMPKINHSRSRGHNKFNSDLN